MLVKFTRHILAGLVLASPVLAFASSDCKAPTVCDDFTQATDSNDWVAQYDACLTAGTASNNTTQNSNIPGCNYSTPDANGQGALRLTAAKNSAHGAIVSNYTFPSSQGLQVTFTTYAYGGDKGGPASDGADGMSFFLQDGSVGTTVNSTSNLGSWGGSLAYSCSNVNSPYVGLTGAYLGLGIDEYGNFLNGGSSHDNTASAIANQTSSSSSNGYNSFAWGSSQQANRIGLRGAGNVSWYWLNKNYPVYYPSSLSSSQQQTAVQNTCKTGVLWDYSVSSAQSISSISNSGTTLTIQIPDVTGYVNGDTVTIAGTINDNAPVQSITNASVSGTTLTLTVPSHGFANGDSVTIAGVTANSVAATITQITETCSKCRRTNPYTYTFTTSSNSFSNGDSITISSSGVNNSGSTKIAGNTYTISNVTSTSFDVTGQPNFGNVTISDSPAPTATDATRMPTIPGSYTVSNVTTNTFKVTLSSTPSKGITRSPTATATGNAASIPGDYTISNVDSSNNTFQITLPSTPGTITNVSGTAADKNENGAGKATTTAIMDYPAIPGGYYVLPATQLLANENVSDSSPPSTSRSDSTTSPITYRLRITPGGLMSLYYSYNGSAYQTVISNFPITTSNGPLPSTFRFGFAGSTGGSTNAHEISCFVAEPTESSSSANANTVQSGQVRTGTQVYLASYNPNDWSGTVVSSPLVVDASGNLVVGSSADWDADCALTGGTCGTTLTSSQTSTAVSPSSRTLLTWNGSAGVPLEWTDLTSTQQTLLNSSDSNGQNRLNWLRGDRSQEQTATPAGDLRARGGVLGDIVNSSPTWIGYPALNYPAQFSDSLYSTATASESSYISYASGTAATRTNVVYVGSNDGMIHGFRAGSFDASKNYVSTSNDGAEIIGFMPSSILATPDANPAADVIALTSPTYGHNYFVDAPPGTGDLYYKSAWHTWLVGGLGAGGKEVYALDVTDPSSFSETNASNIVIGDWTPSSLTSCINVSGTNCGDNLGYSTGIPLIRRLHNGQWAIIFGNGLSSNSGHAGVFVGVINSTTGAITFYWLDTGSGSSSSPNGINGVASADLDGDHVIDYLYAGDLQGNVWRFDLTDQDPTKWGVSDYSSSPAAATPLPTSAIKPLFIAKDSNGNTQPITTKIAVSATSAGGEQRVILGFGTGQGVPFTASTAENYAPHVQTVYGIWDWEMSKWSTSYGSRTGTNAYTRTNLSQVTLSSSSVTGTRSLGTNTVCWKDSTNCSGGATANTQFGWYFDMPDTVTSSACEGTTCNEQVIYNPILSGGELVLNTTLAATTALGQCKPALPTGWTMAFNMESGGAPATSNNQPQNVFANPISQSFSADSSGISIVGLQNNGVGTPWVVAVGSQQVVITQTSSGQAAVAKFKAQGGVQVKMVTWEQLR